MDMKLRIASLVFDALKAGFDACEPDAPAIAAMLEIPPEPGLGDYAFPCFKLAKTLRKGPPMIASTLAQHIDAPETAMGKQTVLLPPWCWNLSRKNWKHRRTRRKSFFPRTARCSVIPIIEP